MADSNGGDPFDLQRFVDAQARVYVHALAEVRRGRKRSHWMWFIFPQLAGLGRSWTAQKYAIASLDEARAYLAHRVLGPRLVECAEALLALDGHTARDIFGGIDTLKLRSSMTLFSLVAEADSPFRRVLAKYFAAEPDGQTLQLLGRDP
jgi:uncharacterized protein (DUF1810 family)